MKVKLLRLVFFLFAININNLYSQNWAAALKLSTLGGNIELYHSFGEKINAHIGFNYFSITRELDQTRDYSAEAKAGLLSFSALGDYFPFESSSFRVTAGLVISLSEADVKLTPIKSYTVGGDIYAPKDLGTLNANVKVKPILPYLGFGFGNPTSGETGLGFIFDVGTIYHGGANVDLTAEGLLEPSASDDQKNRIEDNLSWFKFYPVISVGLSYKF